MTRTEERLSELLHQAADGLAGGVSFEAVARRARTRRLLAAAASAIAVAALTAGAVVAGAALTGRGQGPAAAGHPRPARSQQGRVGFEGVQFTLPAGWTTAGPGCGWPANDTVVIDYQTRPVLYCPAPFRPASLPTSVTLTTIYGPQYANGWTGQRITWHRQPAWLAEQTKQGVTTVTPTLPLLNVAAPAEPPRPARARALPSQLSVPTRPRPAGPPGTVRLGCALHPLPGTGRCPSPRQQQAYVVAARMSRREPRSQAAAVVLVRVPLACH